MLYKTGPQKKSVLLRSLHRNFMNHFRWRSNFSVPLNRGKRCILRRGCRLSVVRVPCPALACSVIVGIGWLGWLGSFTQ
jgi:hypothetical protein